MGGFHRDKNDYPRWNDNNRLVHRDVARNMYGNLGDSVIHHRDGDKGNFRKSNLDKMSRSHHSSYHSRKRR
jgi:hypothetical protein